MPNQTPTIPVLTSVAEFAAKKSVWLCDIWGVLHNGETVFPDAPAACIRFRETGGIVILISNSPRTSMAVAEQLREFDIHERVYDAIVTSGDVTRALVSERSQETFYHLGPERDRSFFEGITVKFAPPDAADVVICTGLVDDETETPDDYSSMLEEFVRRGVPMICANPDLTVERGDRLIPCAGSLAALYSRLGGAVMQAGKPFEPIYNRAVELAGAGIPREKYLAIGDGIDTDIRGAVAQGIDAIYVASRVNMPAAAGHGVSLEGDAVEIAFGDRSFRPAAVMTSLRW